MQILENTQLFSIGKKKMSETALYLVPASPENAWTLTKGVGKNILEEFLLDNDIRAIEREIDDREVTSCWAMTRSNQKIFNEMQHGDIVLFSIKGTGQFSFIGTVIHKIEEETMGRRLWGYMPGKPWDLIYFLRDVAPIQLDKSAIVKALGYAENYVVPGTVRVGDNRLDETMQSNTTLRSFLENFNTGRKQTFSKEVAYQSNTKESSYIRPVWLEDVIRDVEILKKDTEHQERSHEALVQSFLQKLGYVLHTDIVYQRGRVDILIKDKSENLAVVEVKRDWVLENNSKTALEQAYRYSHQNAARYIIITNGDYYAYYDRKKGLSYEDQFMRRFYLTRLTNDDLNFILTVVKKALFTS